MCAYTFFIHTCMMHANSTLFIHDYIFLIHYVCVYIYIYINIYIYIYIYIDTCIRTHHSVKQVQKRDALIHYIYTYIHTSYIHTSYIHTYIHIIKQVQKRDPARLLPLKPLPPNIIVRMANKRAQEPYEGIMERLNPGVCVCWCVCVFFCKYIYIHIYVRVYRNRMKASWRG